MSRTVLTTLNWINQAQEATVARTETIKG